MRAFRYGKFTTNVCPLIERYWLDPTELQQLQSEAFEYDDLLNALWE